MLVIKNIGVDVKTSQLRKMVLFIHFYIPFLKR